MTFATSTQTYTPKKHPKNKRIGFTLTYSLSLLYHIRRPSFNGSPPPVVARPPPHGRRRRPRFEPTACLFFLPKNQGSSEAEREKKGNTARLPPPSPLQPLLPRCSSLGAPWLGAWLAEPRRGRPRNQIIVRGRRRRLVRGLQAATAHASSV